MCVSVSVCASVDVISPAVHPTQIYAVNIIVVGDCHITHHSNLCCSQVSSKTVNCVISIYYVNRTLAF